MQSQYGLPEIQQFMAEGGCSPLFSISSAEIHHSSHLQKPPHSLHLHHHLQMQLRQPPPPPPQSLPPPPPLHHYSPSPATQQLFHSGHQFHLFQQEQQRRIHHQLVQLGLESDSSFLSAVDFKLAINDSRERIPDDEDILQVDEEEEIHHTHMKEPFWRPLDIGYSKRSKEKQQQADGGCNFKLFSELEAICKPITSNGESFHRNNQQAGSGSVLTGDNPPPIPRAHHHETLDQASDSSTGEEAAQMKKSDGGGAGRKRKRSRRQLSSIAEFMEGLVKRMMEHQEGLHRKFLEILERRDRERNSREESWRQQEAARANSEAIARAQDQALSSSREAAIVFFLEKITGESLNLPTRESFHCPPQEEDSKLAAVNPSRWPKAEVQALIKVRSNLEGRFQEPGLKGPLWEEVSLAMAAMGFQRSAKRCKEKWENINKYFRKTKDSVKKRSQQSKTCPYFHQLDQLYSKSPAKVQTSMAEKEEEEEEEEEEEDEDGEEEDGEEEDRESLEGSKDPIS